MTNEAPPVALGLRTRYCGSLGAEDVGQRVTVCGWVARLRAHGDRLVFLDLRDHTGLVQCVIGGDHELRAEYVVAVHGEVRRRPDGTVNDDLASGAVELADCKIEVLAEAETPPMPTDGRTLAEESVRLRYRYVDLRSARMQANLRLRAAAARAIRGSLDGDGFIEVETPLLWTPTPEGAREFVIPSRLQPGSFYVLPQSPQIAKQLLMVGGVDRYYQIARCMRDEDLRADRQFEFTQVDIEASFVTQQDVWRVVTSAVLAATEVAAGAPPPPAVVMTWAEAMDRYGTDKPDLRSGPPLVDVTAAFAESSVVVLRAPSVKCFCVPGGAARSRSELDRLVERAKQLGAKGLVWARVAVDGDDPRELGLASPVDRHLSHDERQELLAASGASAGDLLLVVADAKDVAARVLGQLRLECCRPPVTEGPFRFVWISDFPLFEGRDEHGVLISAHHPFTMPNLEDLDRMETDPLSVRSQSYDLVCNGWELGSGSIRIHRGDIQRRVFAALGIPAEEAERRFGFLLGAFRYGAPPHGGFAFGLDRLVAILAGEENIREVIAFPKTQSGADLMSGAPRPVAPAVLGELGIVVPPRSARD
jgi:aspartyl-tRNA synthetase